MAVGQKQIAEKLGVSIALVSRVLSGKAQEIGIAPETIERVLQTAEEMGYVPSAAALSLKGKITRTLGVTVYDFNDPFFGALIKQIQTQAHEHNYSLVLAGFLNRIPDAQDLQSLRKHALDGLIVLGSDPEAAWLQDFDQLPVARIGHGPAQENSFKIAVDEADAAGQLITHLQACGRSRLCCISGALPSHRLRMAALKKAAAANGLSLTEHGSGEKSPFSAGQNLARQLLSSSPDTDALICTTDQIALGALHALHAAGIGVPGQMAVTGFDDIPVAAQFIPPLTTVRQPLKEMVQRAFQAVIHPEPAQTVYLKGTLLIRESSRAVEADAETSSP